MKAILVIDIPMTEDNKHICNYCPIWNDDKRVCQYSYHMATKKCPLRPMPLKRETQVAWQGIGGMKVQTHEPSEYDKGWNDCVDFLEGEEYD